MPSKSIVISVTASDIRYGYRAVCECCPVARALQRAINRTVKVFSREFYYQQPRTHRWIYDNPLPEKVSHFIAAFDSAQPVRPFRFTINLPK